MEEQPKFYTVGHAAEALGVSRWKVWKLLKDGEMKGEPNPLDKRETLIPAAEIERLSGYVSPRKNAAA